MGNEWIWIVGLILGAWIAVGLVVLHDYVKEIVRIQKLHDQEDREWESTQRRTDLTEPAENSSGNTTP